MTAYYNEFDPYAAQWLRNLIAAGHIAPGEVDERSIKEVRPDDLKGFTQCHFFAGIGVWSYALRSAGWSDDRPVWTGSCPCQPFSAAGKGEGLDDPRHLWPDWFRLILERRPVVVFGEQVAGPDGVAWLDLAQSDLEEHSHTVGTVVTCSAGFGGSDIRQRIYWVAHADKVGCGSRSGTYMRGNPTLTGAARLTGWQTPTVNDSKNSDYSYSRGDHDKPFLKLPGEVKLAGWLSPTANEDAAGNPGARCSRCSRVGRRRTRWTGHTGPAA
jgi:DNA (cytosine-5)-methyltransferase 1